MTGTSTSLWPEWTPWLTGGLAVALALLLAHWWVLRRRLHRQALALRHARRDRDLILGSITDNVTFLDRELRIVWTNWANRAGGITESPIEQGAVCHAVIAGRAEPCAGCPAPEVLRTGQPQEGVVTCRDGSILRLSAAPVRDETGRLAGVVQIARDITDKRLIAERLHRSQKLEAVGQLAAGVAHDFNNSLQVVLGYADLLASLLPPGSDARGFVGAMNRAGQQARDVVRQLLTFSRKREPRTERVDLGAWLIEQRGILQRLLGPRIQIEVQVAPDLLPVLADVVQIEQALLSLSTNARDAMPTGGRLDLALSLLELTPGKARRLGAPAAGAYVVLSVSDQGEGIPPELQDRVFDPFFTTKDVDRGTGLGLATVYGIVQAHHGFVELESQPGQGTTFRVGLPADQPALQTAVEPIATPQGRGRILVVDEDPAVRQLAVTVLRRAGHDVEEAISGASALAKLEEADARYDLVVIDALLSGMNGWTLFRVARRRLPALRAILCSDHDPELLEAHLASPLPELVYLQKPYRATDLASRAAALLELMPPPKESVGPGN